MHLHHDHGVGAGGIAAGDTAVCPVMNITVNKQDAVKHGLVKTHQGKNYYLCCDSCISTFDKDPDHYAGKEQ